MTTIKQDNASSAPVERWVRLFNILIIILITNGCEINKTSQKQIDGRIALFKECMELAGKMPRQADDDVADVVDSCSSQAYYMTNHIE